ncbi:hypothetical protein N9Z27_01450 [Alphaproteobacteria bacterium]|nr:hypothetical protein [Alphaproteobacteria bacterium]
MLFCSEHYPHKQNQVPALPSTKPLTTRFNEIELLIAKTIEYLAVPSVVGHEFIFMDHLEQDFKNLGLTTKKYKGALEISGKTPLSAIVCAHIDRHGLISTGDGEYAYAAQYIREQKYGEPNPQSKNELFKIATRFEGEQVYAYDDSTGKKLGEGTIHTCFHQMENGDSVFNVNEMDHAKEGTALAYSRMAYYKDNNLSGQIDNTISIGTVYALFKNGFQGTALLTCEEEIGKSWLHITEVLDKKKIQTQNLVVIDTSPFNDDTEIKEGPVVFRSRDFRETFNDEMLDEFKQRAGALEIPFIVKDDYLINRGKTTEQLGSTELGRLIKHRERQWSGSTVQIPTLAYHTSYETTSKTAILNYYAFLHNILVEWPMNFANRT